MRGVGGRSVLRNADDLCAALGIAFSEEQLAAATAPLEPGVIIAGAGSGKTTVMAARVVWLVGRGEVRPEQVLGLTFTRKAAAELSQRVRGALVRSGVANLDPWIAEGEEVVMTYDAFAARLVAEHGLRIGVESDQTMLSGAGRFRLASRAVAAAAGPFENICRLRPTSVTERVLALDNDLQNHLVSARQLDDQARWMRVALGKAPLYRGNLYASVRTAAAVVEERLELASLTEAYQDLKLDLGLVEFADQMAIAARIAEHLPTVSAQLRAQFKVVLLDEYQDTSSAQARLLRGLFSGADEASGLGHPVTAVGDPFQAIYGWRGAAASNIAEFAESFPAICGPAKSYPLTVNRRSGPQILEVANDVAESLRADPLARVDLSQARLVAPAEAGSAEIWAAGFHTWPEEVAWIADQVVELHRGERGVAWAEIAVLGRRNADLGDLFSALTNRDVPVEIVGLGGLLSLPEVLDVTSTLRVIADPTANPAMVRLLTGARWAIGAADLALLGQRAMELSGRSGRNGELSFEAQLESAVAQVDPTEVVSLAEALAEPGEHPYSAAARERFGVLAAELAELRRHATEPVLDLCRRVIDTLGVEAEVAVSAPERSAQLARFLAAVAAYVDVDGQSSLSGLLAYLDAEVDHGVGLELDVPRASAAVQLLTIHKAKGLEWDVVFLPALVKDVFPSDRVTTNWVTMAQYLPATLRGDRASVPQLQEVSNKGIDAYRDSLKEENSRAEDRLAYVGITRARRTLVATAHTWRAQLSRPRSPSRYHDLVSRHAARSGRVWAVAPPAGATHPLESETRSYSWPQLFDEAALSLRQSAADAVAAARREHQAVGEYPGDHLAHLDEAAAVAGWDAELALLEAEMRAGQRTHEVPLPFSLAVSGVVAAHRDAGEFARGLARPMPRKPSRAAHFGVRFHDWVQRQFGQQTLLVPEPDEVDVLTAIDEDDFRDVCERFLVGQFGSRAPLALEVPFTMSVGGQLVRGRIDAVYAGAEPDTYLVVDWKTGAREDSDPLQLACYRLAWAGMRRVDPASVDAAFYFVRSDRLVHPELVDLAGLNALLRKVTD